MPTIIEYFCDSFIVVQVSIGYKEIFRLTIPIMFSLLVPQLNFFTNTIFLGAAHDGEAYLAVIAITGIFYLALSMIGYGLANGIQIMLSRRAGEKNTEGIGRLMGTGAVVTIGLSMLLVLLSLWLAPLIFKNSLHSELRVAQSLEFLYVRLWGLPLLLLTQLGNAFYISVHKSTNLLLASVASTIVNIVLDYMLIMGHWGFPSIGLQGAAWASVAGELAGFLAVWFIYFYKPYHRQYTQFLDWKFNPTLAKSVLVVSSPLIIQFFFSIGGWQVFFILIEHLGQAPLAASQILRSIYGILGIFVWAFAAATGTMVSNIIAQGRQDQVFALVKRVCTASFLTTLAMCVVLYAFAYPVLAAYRDDAELIALALPSLRIIILAALVMSLSSVVFNAVVGTGNTGVNLIIEITSVLCYLLYCYVVIERMQSSLEWAWCAEFVYWTVALVICFFYLRSNKWKGKVI